MDLAGYMAAKGIDDAAMGARLTPPKNRVTVSRYRRGLEPIPSLTVKQLVEMSADDAAGHKMTADELLGIEQPQAAE